MISARRLIAAPGPLAPESAITTFAQAVPPAAPIFTSRSRITFRPALSHALSAASSMASQTVELQRRTLACTRVAARSVALTAALVAAFAAPFAFSALPFAAFFTVAAPVLALFFKPANGDFGERMGERIDAGALAGNGGEEATSVITGVRRRALDRGVPISCSRNQQFHRRRIWEFFLGPSWKEALVSIALLAPL